MAGSDSGQAARKTSAIEPSKSDPHDTEVRPASYSTGAAGHTLKWLSVRPLRREVTERTVEYRSDADNGPVRVTSGEDPFKDPFGDFGDTNLLPQDATPSPPERDEGGSHVFHRRPC